MGFAWILNPATPFAFLALGLVGCLALFLSMKKEIAVLNHCLKDSLESAAAAAANALEARLAAMQQELATAGAASLADQQLNLTKRAQALRMQRRGEPSSTIAAVLRLPQNEIDLLIKLQNLVADPLCARK